jgi:survival-of-motor-neuron-related-splicing factor 30
LQQVEAALTTDPDNEDLLKLKSDLQEVITLTQELVDNRVRRFADSDQDDDDDEDNDGESSPVAATSSASAAAETRAWLSSDITWKAGYKCRAPWSDNHQYYAATVDEILEDGSCSVIFERYGTTEVTQLSLLRPWDEAEEEEGTAAKKPKTKKDLSLAQREYKKKKAQKKAQRLKQMEDEREQDKNKWIQFNSKVFSKTSKGKVKKSIFATPDTTSGRVGVGTCGVSGRPMTKFTYMEKYKK